MANQQTQARRRAEVILQVRSGQLTAEAAAKELGVSRKTYYKWEERALKAMLSELEDRPPGRPSTQEPPEVQKLQERIKALEEEAEIQRKRDSLREALAKLEKKKSLRDEP